MLQRIYSMCSMHVADEIKQNLCDIILSYSFSQRTDDVPSNDSWSDLIKKFTGKMCHVTNLL